MLERLFGGGESQSQKLEKVIPGYTSAGHDLMEEINAYKQTLDLQGSPYEGSERLKEIIIRLKTEINKIRQDRDKLNEKDNKQLLEEWAKHLEKHTKL